MPYGRAKVKWENIKDYIPDNFLGREKIFKILDEQQTLDQSNRKDRFIEVVYKYDEEGENTLPEKFDMALNQLEDLEDAELFFETAARNASANEETDEICMPTDGVAQLFSKEKNEEGEEEEFLLPSTVLQASLQSELQAIPSLEETEAEAEENEEEAEKREDELAEEAEERVFEEEIALDELLEKIPKNYPNRAEIAKLLGEHPKENVSIKISYKEDNSDGPFSKEILEENFGKGDAFWKFLQTKDLETDGLVHLSPYSVDLAVKNFNDASQRVEGILERLGVVGELEVPEAVAGLDFQDISRARNQFRDFATEKNNDGSAKSINLEKILEIQAMQEKMHQWAENWEKWFEEYEGSDKLPVIPPNYDEIRTEEAMQLETKERKETAEENEGREEDEETTMEGRFDKTCEKYGKFFNFLNSRKDLIENLEVYLKDFYKEYKEYCEFNVNEYKEDNSGNPLPTRLNLSERSERFYELQGKIDEWNKKCEEWMKNPSQPLPKYKASASATSEVREVSVSSLPAASAETNSWFSLEEAFFTGADTGLGDTRRRPDVGFFNQMHKQSMKKLTDIATQARILSKGAVMDPKAFKIITDAWIKNIDEANTKDKSDYANVSCKRLSKDSIKTKIELPNKTEEITHTYDSAINRPKITMTDPPSDQSIFLFMKSSKEMAPLTLQAPCGSLDTAFKLYEASILSGTKIELHSDDVEALKTSKYKDNFGALRAIENNEEAVEKFRNQMKTKPDYELGKLENKPEVPDLSFVGRKKK